MSEGVRIRYENDLDDLVAFTKYHVLNSPHLRRLHAIGMWAVPMVALAVGIVVDLVQGTLGWTVWAALFGVLYVLLLRRGYGRHLERSVRALYSEGRNEAVLGEHVLEAHVDGLVVRTPSSESRVSWSVIERVAETDDYAFLYTQATAGLVVPRGRLQEGDLDAFLVAVREGMAGSREAGETANAPA